MNSDRFHQDAVRIASTPPIAEKLTELASHPSQIDEVSNRLGIPATLLNFYLAKPADFSSIGLGNGILIPVQITRRRGGRKSFYYLSAGEEILAGIFVTDQAIALRYVGRVTGSSVPAQTGDTYSMRITNREGQVIFQGEGKLEVIDALKGKGRIEFSPPQGGPSLKLTWDFWSLLSSETPADV